RHWADANALLAGHRRRRWRRPGRLAGSSRSQLNVMADEKVIDPAHPTPDGADAPESRDVAAADPAADLQRERDDYYDRWVRKKGVTPIEAVGADFDPNLHQAVTQEASAGHRDGEVLAELRRGYLINGRLLRPAMVKVAKA